MSVTRKRTKEISLKDFRGLSALCVSCIVEAIRDISYADPAIVARGTKAFRASRADVKSARAWLYDDNHDCVLPLRQCCEIISYFIAVHGYRIELTPASIRAHIESTAPADLISQLEACTKTGRDAFPGELAYDAREDQHASRARTYQIAA